jgi:isocitrate dehydrogenase (NAD+)
MILSGVLMLKYLGEEKAALALENAVKSVIIENKSVTYDFKPDPKDPSAVGTKEMADAIIAKLK